MGEDKQAVYWLKRCIKSNVMNFRAFNSLGSIFYKLRNYSKSIYYYKKSIENSIDYYPPFYGLGNVYSTSK